MTTEHINPLKSYPFETNTQTEQLKTEKINFTPQSRIISLSSGFNLPNKNSDVKQHVTFTDLTDIKSKDSENKSKNKITDYIISDVQPSSFKPQSTIPPENLSDRIHLTNDDLPSINKTLKITLSSGVTATSLPILSQGMVQEIPLYFRPRQNSSKRELTQQIDPTTYSPSKSWKLQVVRNPAPFSIPVSNSVSDTTDSTESNSFINYQRKPVIDENYQQKIIAKENQPAYRPIESYTSRGLIFKESLNKNYESSTYKPIVSPYRSLESILQTTTARSDYQAYPTTTSLSPTSFRSYFLITAPPKNLTIETTTPTTTTPSTTTTTPITTTITEEIESTTNNSEFSKSTENSRGRYRPYIYTTHNSIIDYDEPTTYSPKFRYSSRYLESTTDHPIRRKKIRTRILPTTTSQIYTRPQNIYTESPEEITTSFARHQISSKFVGQVQEPKSRKIESGYYWEKQALSDVTSLRAVQIGNNEERVVEITDKPIQHILRPNYVTSEKNFNDKYNRDYDEEYIKKLIAREKFRATVEMPEFNVPTEKEIISYQETVQPDSEVEDEVIEQPNVLEVEEEYEEITTVPTTTTTTTTTSTTTTVPPPPTTTTESTTLPPTTKPTTTTQRQIFTTSTANPKMLLPPRISRVNNAIKTTIAAAVPRRIVTPASLNCTDNTPNTKCNEIPTRYKNF